MNPIVWGALNSAPNGPGVYAWYYGPRFTAFDRNALDRELIEEPNPNNVEKFLTKHLFDYFDESPYHVTLKGPLKAPYSGIAAHERLLTHGLSQRLAESAERRKVLWDALEKMVPYFAAPLYIGMAKSLRKRLRQHKNFIEGGLENLSVSTRSDTNSLRDKGFASEVLRRKLAVERLSVYVLELPEEAIGTATDLENILNRVNYPVFGRN